MNKFHSASSQSSPLYHSVAVTTILAALMAVHLMADMPIAVTVSFSIRWGPDLKVRIIETIYSVPVQLQGRRLFHEAAEEQIKHKETVVFINTMGGALFGIAFLYFINVRFNLFLHTVCSYGVIFWTWPQTYDDVLWTRVKSWRWSGACGPSGDPPACHSQASRRDSSEWS